MLLDGSQGSGESIAMDDKEQFAKMVWPRWATWALVAVVLTTILTVAAMLNDIY